MGGRRPRTRSSHSPKGGSGRRRAPASAPSRCSDQGASRAQAQLVLARIHAARGELPQARADLAQAWGTLHECPDAGVVPARAERRRRGARRRAPSTGEPVSAAERLVLEQLAGGRSNAEIASALFLSPNTIKTHLRTIYKKLGVHSREAAVARARALGLLDSPG